MQGNERLPSDKDKTGQKAAEGQGQIGSKGCQATTIQGNERRIQGNESKTKGCRGTRTKRVERLPRDKVTRERKAAERQGRHGSKG